MISFRYHVVSLVAVLLALAVGIALGGGPLQRSPLGDQGDGGQSLVEAQDEIARLQRGTAFADDFADRTADRLLGGTLSGRAVTLIALPGADDADVKKVAEMVGRAGATVSLRALLGEKLLDVGNRQLVFELAGQMASSGGKDLEGAAGASGYEQMALLLSEVLVSRKAEGEDIDPSGRSIAAGLGTADLLTLSDEDGRRGSLALVVTGDPYGSADQREGAGSILSTLVTVLDEHSDGVVVAGPVPASADDGLIGSVRADPTAAAAVSTVDTVERSAGAVAAVLALEAEARGKAGHYGTAAAGGGAVPAPATDG